MSNSLVFFLSAFLKYRFKFADGSGQVCIKSDTYHDAKNSYEVRYFSFVIVYFKILRKGAQCDLVIRQKYPFDMENFDTWTKPYLKGFQTYQSRMSMVEKNDIQECIYRNMT